MGVSQVTLVGCCEESEPESSTSKEAAAAVKGLAMLPEWTSALRT